MAAACFRISNVKMNVAIGSSVGGWEGRVRRRQEQVTFIVAFSLSSSNTYLVNLMVMSDDTSSLACALLSSMSGNRERESGGKI